MTWYCLPLWSETIFVSLCGNIHPVLTFLIQALHRFPFFSSTISLHYSITTQFADRTMLWVEEGLTNIYEPCLKMCKCVLHPKFTVSTAFQTFGPLPHSLLFPIMIHGGSSIEHKYF